MPVSVTKPSRIIEVPRVEPPTVIVALMFSRDVGVTTIFNRSNPEVCLIGVTSGRSGIARVDREVPVACPFFIFLFPIAAI